ncbi:cupin domain-containing protein [Edaphovirga cremea]|uniref:cupin domain-containing protein n=1 Tax=Edaphovirga cremea TaxID=2267246 RepID=UPI000DEEFD08|nr:cupin domain-containing protein [Edaphovirga cremea]
MNKDQLIEDLSLVRHEEGGFYKECFRSDHKIKTERKSNSGTRALATCIFYMLTDDYPIGYFHKNQSPILHFFHAGGPLIYRFIHPDGRTEKHILGPDIDKGHKLQLVGPGNCWKSTELIQGESFGLISEVVFPGWEQDDWAMATQEELYSALPQHRIWIEKYGYKNQV